MSKKKGEPIMDTVINKISALAQVNEEIISRIQQKTDTKKYHYHLSTTTTTTTPAQVGCPNGCGSAYISGGRCNSCGGGLWNGYQTLQVTVTAVPKETLQSVVSIQESTKQVQTSTILASWKNTQTLKEIPDVFNDKVVYSIQNFNNLVDLNKRLPAVARKYELFGESSKAVKQLSLFLDNLEVIQVCLGEIEARLIDDKSSLQKLQQEIDKANKILMGVLQMESVELATDAYCRKC